MAINRPDEYQHQNPALPIVRASNVRGGGRRVADLATLYALASEPEKLEEGVTVAYVTSEAATYRLTALIDAGEAAGWAKEGAAPTSAPLSLVNDDTQIPAASYVAALNAPELANFTLLRLNSSYQEFGGVQPPDKRYAVLDGQQGELYTGTNFYLFAPRVVTAIRLSSTTVRANPVFEESIVQYSELANSKVDPNGKTVVLLNVQVTGSTFTQGDTDWTTGTGTIILRGDSDVDSARTVSSGVTVQYQQVSDGGGGTSLPANQTAALGAANNPSAANPYATIADTSEGRFRGLFDPDRVYLVNDLVLYYNSLWTASSRHISDPTPGHEPGFELDNNNRYWFPLLTGYNPEIGQAADWQYAVGLDGTFNSLYDNLYSTNNRYFELRYTVGSGLIENTVHNRQLPGSPEESIPAGYTIYVRIPAGFRPVTLAAQAYSDTDFSSGVGTENGTLTLVAGDVVQLIHRAAGFWEIGLCAGPSFAVSGGGGETPATQTVVFAAAYRQPDFNSGKDYVGGGAPDYAPATFDLEQTVGDASLWNNTANAFLPPVSGFYICGIAARPFDATYGAIPTATGTRWFVSMLSPTATLFDECGTGQVNSNGSAAKSLLVYLTAGTAYRLGVYSDVTVRYVSADFYATLVQADPGAPSPDPAPAPTNLSSDSDGNVSFTPQAGSNATDYEYELP